MELPLTREEAMELIKKYSPSEADMNHYIESESIMKSLARKFGEDEEYWGMLGLLHDVDWAITKDNPSEHISKTPSILKEAGFNDKFIDIIISHVYGFDLIPKYKNEKRVKKVEHCLAAGETITGLIYAYALMRSNKISDMTVKGLKKKFKDKTFASGCDREIIREIEKTGLSLDEFFELSIEAIKNIKNEIGLE